MNHAQLLAEIMDTLFHLPDSFSRGLPVAADIVSKLFLVDAGYPFQTGQGKRIGKLLKERRNIITENKLHILW